MRLLGVIKTLGRIVSIVPQRLILRSYLITAAMPIKEGESLPNIDLFEETPANKVNLNELSAGKKIIVFAVPGAFTPGCSKTHLPGYVKKAEELKLQGISEIACVAVNDPFVMSAWGKEHNVNGKIRMLADTQATFTKSIDLGQDLAPLGGYRSKRYSMVVENGKVQSLQVDPMVPDIMLVVELSV
uniref:Peroxiredoxin-5 n=1 Tax=Pyrocoelia rufa TaxID=71223 RepID=Q8MUN0_PYRRU|nr:peroxiredoxin [Pyrocoelia rufa]